MTQDEALTAIKFVAENLASIRSLGDLVWHMGSAGVSFEEIQQA